jgi:hypothetical protein
MIAISYRREDSLPVTGRLYDRLQAEFGRGKVFMDFDSIPYGVDFRDHIKQMIDRSKVLVAIIGPNWMGKRKQRGRRIDEPTDFVRLEIGYALERKLPIIPILVGQTQMPRSEELPKDIEALAFRNGLNLDIGIDFHHHAERLVAAINRILTAPPSTPPLVQQPQLPPAVQTPTEPSLAPPELRQEATTLQPTAIIQKPPPAESTPAPVRAKQDAIVSEAKAEKTEIAPPSPVKDRQARSFIDVHAPINAIRAAFAKLAQAFVKVLSTARSGTSSLFNAIGTRTGNFLRYSGGQLRRKSKAIAFSAITLVVVAIVVGAIYWGVRSGTFQGSRARTTEFFKSKNITKIEPSSPPPGVVSRPNANPATAQPSTPGTPAHIRGALVIDSTPEGEAYEVIDSNNKHHTGKTPGTLQDLPEGYAQVFFRREGFSDHTRSVWISPNTKPSVSWNFPEDYRLKPMTPVEPSATAAPTIASASAPPSSPTPAPPANPVAQNGRPSQVWISDFVKQFVAVNQSQDANALVAFYAPSVDYFGSRGKDQPFILRDVQKYNVEWPARRDSIEGDIHVEEKIPNQQYRASFKQDFYAENPKTSEWSKGQVATILDINIIDGVPKIAAINQKRLQRQNGRGKGPRPPDMEPPGPIKPAKLTKVIVKKYGFSALLPPELFPDAEAKLADGATDRLTSLKGCATVAFTAPHEDVRKVYDEYVKQFEAASDHRMIDYKVVKDTWFVVSGSSRTTGYYVKGVRHGDDVFVMELDYVGAVCRIPGSMVAEMSHAFNGN